MLALAPLFLGLLFYTVNEQFSESLASRCKDLELTLLICLVPD